MKRGKISVYSGRGMVIGCAEAGKTTLVKKLKGERDLNTVSTSGIEIHSHVFKLSTDESTINGKYFPICAFNEHDYMRTHRPYEHFRVDFLIEYIGLVL